MRETVPKHTLALKNSIGWRFGRAPKGKIPLGSLRVANSTTKVVIYAGNDEAFYARFQEFGTRINVAQPFFWNSWRASRGSARKSIETAVRGGIAKAVR
jgi:HK97 gp10 family phage protein